MSISGFWSDDLTRLFDHVEPPPIEEMAIADSMDPEETQRRRSTAAHALWLLDLGMVPLPTAHPKTCLAGYCNLARSEGLCTRPGKHPAVKLANMLKPDYTPSREWVLEVWTSRKVGVGLVTGRRSGVVVVECDDQAAYEYLQKFGMFSPYFVLSGIKEGGFRGIHFYYRAPVDVAIKSVSRPIKGVALDVRGEGGYVAFPPSEHLSGVKYEFGREWGDDWPVHLPPLPQPFCDLFDKPAFEGVPAHDNKPVSKKDAVLLARARMLTFGTVKKGSRNEKLVLMCRIVTNEFGLDYADSLRVLTKTVKEQFEGTVSKADIEGRLQWAMDRKDESPRTNNGAHMLGYPALLHGVCSALAWKRLPNEVHIALAQALWKMLEGGFIPSPIWIYETVK